MCYSKYKINKVLLTERIVNYVQLESVCIEYSFIDGISRKHVLICSNLNVHQQNVFILLVILVLI